MIQSLTTLTTLALLGLSQPSAPTGPASVDEWPQWRGPSRNGISTEQGWTPKGRAGWKAEVGLGYSAFVIQDGRLYTAGFERDEDQDIGQDTVWCMDAETGEALWSYSYPAKIWAKYHGGGTLSTPVIDEDVVYWLNREAEFRCFDAESGELLWEKPLLKEYDLKYPEWAFSASPLVLEEAVILNLGRVFAFERKTGKLLSVTDKNYGDAYATARDCTLAGKQLLAIFAGNGLILLDRETLAEVASHKWETRYNVNAATPLIAGNDEILISSGYGHGGALLRYTEDGFEVVWEVKHFRNHMATSVLIGDHFYGIDEAQLRCLDRKGEEQWKLRGIGKGAMSAAGDKLLLMTSDGELVVAKADSGEFKELSREKVLDGGVYWTMPVLANGRIYCRNSKGGVVCRDHRPIED